MPGNSFGQKFVITSFGESHGVALGVVIDGCPSQIKFDEELIRQNMKRRRPGQHGGKPMVNSARQEEDQFEVLSGVFEMQTLGTPIALIVRNQDARSGDYQQIQQHPRPGHADDVWKSKYGHIDWRGGGRASGRETVARVLGGSVAQMVLKAKAPTLQVVGFARSIGPIALTDSEVELLGQSALTVSEVDNFSVRIPHQVKNKEVETLLLEAKNVGDSYGGVVELWIKGVPSGLGQPVFHKIKADLALAMMSVGATAGVEFGIGFEAVAQKGSQFHSGLSDQQHVYGGIRGGLTTGEKIVMRIALKPTSSLGSVAKSGRHDPCIVPRAIPVFEAMAHLVLADHLLLS